jgi:N-methylhydantoinase B/oxoprolinase/acetone carboxylase alpha subunit
VTFTYALEARLNPPHGVRGGADGTPAHAWIENTETGEPADAPPVASLELKVGERIVSIAAGGGGYGDPCEREVEVVMDDLLEGRITEEAASSVYGVVTANGTLDAEATAREREGRRPAYTPSA